MNDAVITISSIQAEEACIVMSRHDETGCEGQNVSFGDWNEGNWSLTRCSSHVLDAKQPNRCAMQVGLCCVLVMF